MVKETTEKQRRFLEKVRIENGYYVWKDSGDLVHRTKAYKMFKADRKKYPLPWRKYQVHHKDGDKLNNRMENLEIVTREEHRKIHGVKSDRASGWELFFIILFIISITALFMILIFSLRDNKITNGGIICGYDTYDCVNFDTCEEATNVLRTCGSDDIHFLDGDGDGIPCEDLCG